MTTMISELYEALIDAGATEEKAREAAVALSAENLNSKDTIAELDQRLGGRIAELDKKMAVLQWMMGATLTGVAAIIVKLFFAA